MHLRIKKVCKNLELNKKEKELDLNEIDARLNAGWDVNSD